MVDRVAIAVDTLVMSMNIKNPEAHRLAREITAITGETVTEAVTVALRERLDRLQQRKKRTPEERLQRIREITRETSQLTAHWPDSTVLFDDLYDEYGLPK
jgi:antitoxin VapB